MYDYGARFYDPATGRWFTPDAMAEKYYNQSLYVYTLNNPIYYVDPDGNQVAMCCDSLIGFAATMVDNAFSTNISGYLDTGTTQYASGVQSGNRTSLIVGAVLQVKGVLDTGAGGTGMAASVALEATSGGTATVVAGPGFAASAGLTITGIIETALGTNMMNNASDNIKNESSSSSGSKPQRNKPKQEGVPNSSEIQSKSTNGTTTKYTTYDKNGKIVKEYRGTGKDHGDIPRPNVKEPKFNVNPKTGEQFQNGYKVRKPLPEEIPIQQ